MLKVACASCFPLASYVRHIAGAKDCVRDASFVAGGKRPPLLRLAAFRQLNFSAALFAASPASVAFAFGVHDWEPSEPVSAVHADDNAQVECVTPAPKADQDPSGSQYGDRILFLATHAQTGADSTDS